MDLRISHPRGAWNGNPAENVFFIADATGRQLGTAYVVYQYQPHLYPERPINIFFSVEARQEARYVLLGAVVARGRQLRDQQPSATARLYTCILPDDAESQSFYLRAGLSCEDNESMMLLSDSGLDTHIPMGCQVAQTPLNTVQEQQAFMSRLRANDITHIDSSYLSEILRTQHCCALGIFNGQRLIGEALMAGVGGNCELVAIYVERGSRRQGIGRALMQQAMALMHREGVTRFTARFISRSEPQMGLCRAFRGTPINTLALFPSIDIR